MPSLGWEGKPSVPCRSFAACKRSLHLPWKSQEVGKIGSVISRPYFPPSLIEDSHVAGRGAPLEMTGETKSGEQRALPHVLGSSGLQGPGSAPTLLLLLLLLFGVERRVCALSFRSPARVSLQHQVLRITHAHTQNAVGYLRLLPVSVHSRSGFRLYFIQSL
jgi:hypothetical protein